MEMEQNRRIEIDSNGVRGPRPFDIYSSDYRVVPAASPEQGNLTAEHKHYIEIILCFQMPFTFFNFYLSLTQP